MITYNRSETNLYSIINIKAMASRSKKVSNAMARFLKLIPLVQDIKIFANLSWTGCRDSGIYDGTLKKPS